MLQRLARSRVRVAEAGQSLVLVALTLPVLLGMVGLGVDFGRLATEQRKLQNYADAAALAGAQDLSEYHSQACTDAGTSLTANSNPASVSCNVSTTDNANDTITVTLSQTMAMDFMPVLGVSSKSISATGKAITGSLTGCNDNSNDTGTYACAPYAVWRPSATSGCADQFQPGMTVVFRDNGWAGTTGASSCSAWGTNSNNFKGFIRPNWSSKDPATCAGSDPICTGTNALTTSGGNACGQEPVTDIQDAYSNDTYLILPEFDSSSGNGSNITVQVPGFIVISLNFTYPYPNQIQSVTLNGPPTGGTFTLTYGGKTTSPIPATSMMDAVTITGSPTGGTFKLSYGGQTTSAIAYNATAATVQSDLQSLSTIGAGNATVTLSGTTYLVTFGGSITSGSLQTLSAVSSLTGGSSPAISAVAGTDAGVQSALQGLSSIGSGNVTVQDSDGSYLVTFGGSLTLTSLGVLTSSSSLTGGTSPAISIAQTETSSSKEGTASQKSDYTCPATWYGMVVDSSATGGALSGMDTTSACISTSDSCDIRLQP